VDTEERLSSLEKRQDELEGKLLKLVAFARLYPMGRIILKSLGLS
jgi:hypothetical protein